MRAQVRLGPDYHGSIGYVAGGPFPLLDPDDLYVAPYVATKIMGTSTSNRIATDDFDLRFFECQVAKQILGADAPCASVELSEVARHAGNSDLERTEVESQRTETEATDSTFGFINMGAADRNFFPIKSMTKASN